MRLEEGQIYEGPVAALGAEGPVQRWIIVSPFGKTHGHSIGDPMELHCMPLGIAQRAIEDGRLVLIGTDLTHPTIRLQRIKETLRLEDTHLGLHGDSLERMLVLMEDAARQGDECAPYAAGEVLALMSEPRQSPEEIAAVVARVERAMTAWQGELQS